MNPQSPSNNYPTMPERTLEKGVGYATIYISDRMKIEISTNYSVLRITHINKIGHPEYLYHRESDPVQISEIEDRSFLWDLLASGRSIGYYVEIQKNADRKVTGNIRIVLQRYAKVTGILSKELVADKGKYVYYVRRK